MTMFNGLTSDLGDLTRLSNARSRSISPENLTGEKGMGGMATEGTGAAFARELGRGWAAGIVVWQCTVAWIFAALTKLLFTYVFPL